jgi:hypothetical protein
MSTFATGEVMHRPLAEAIEYFVRGIRASRRPEDRKLAADYLVALAPLLAAAVLGRDILRELPTIDRLFGQTWLIDDTPFREALARWRTFREEYKEFALSGMTVNERLFVLGTLESFDHARAARDRREVERLLREAHVDEPSIQRIVGDL